MVREHHQEDSTVKRQVTRRYNVNHCNRSNIPYENCIMSAKENDRASHHSGTTRTSASSATAAARARARAEAARVRASFADREIKLKLEMAEKALEKVRLESELEALTIQREAAAATAQADILEAAEEQANPPRSKHSQLPLEEEIEDRTSAYVKQQNELLNNSLHESPAPPPIKLGESLITWGTAYWGSQDVGLPSVQQPIKSERALPSKPEPSKPPHHIKRYEDLKPHIQNMNPLAQPYTPRHTTPADPGQNPVMTDFVRYLARRELVITGLNQFDDLPESFRAWQSSFLNAIKGLDISASE